jgi:hypothetical protein
MGETLNNHLFWDAKTLNQRVMYEGNKKRQSAFGSRRSAKTSAYNISNLAPQRLVLNCSSTHLFSNPT